MLTVRSVGPLFLLAAIVSPALGLSAAAAQASAQAGVTVAFEADLAKAAAAPRGAIKAGGAQWSCTMTHCTGKGAGSDPAATCKALAQQVGPLKTFTAAGRAIDIKTCAAAPAMVAAPMMRSAPVAAQKAAPIPAPAPAPAPAGAPKTKKTAAAGTGIAFTTQPFMLTGTGVAAPRAAFTPLAWTSTPAITLTGTGVAPTTRTVSISWTTDTMKLTGHP